MVNDSYSLVISMPVGKKKQTKPSKKAVDLTDNDLIEAFKAKEMSTLDFVVWKPQEAGEILWGQINKTDVSNKFGTPFLVVADINNEEKTVYLKSVLINVFLAAEWLKSATEWSDDIGDAVGQLIGFQYQGKQLNESTGREFESYKVLFDDEIPESFVDRWNQEIGGK